MKIFLVLLFPIVLISCKKEDKNLLFEIGKGEGMNVNFLHDSLNSFISPGYDYANNSLDVDLDGDNYADLKFSSISDSIHYPDEIIFKRLKVEVINDFFKLSSYPNSGLLYEKNWEEYDYYGTFPRKTKYHQYSCIQGADYNPSIYGIVSHEFNVTKFFKSGDKVLLDEQTWEAEYSIYNLSMTPFEEAYYNFSIGGDSLIGDYNIYPNYCYLPSSTEPNFLVFQRTVGNEVSYGWLKIEITGYNQLYIESSAIQD